MLHQLKDYDSRDLMILSKVLGGVAVIECRALMTAAMEEARHRRLLDQLVATYRSLSFKPTGLRQTRVIQSAFANLKG